MIGVPALCGNMLTSVGAKTIDVAGAAASAKTGNKMAAPSLYILVSDQVLSLIFVVC